VDAADDEEAGGEGGQGKQEESCRQLEGKHVFDFNVSSFAGTLRRLN
jgi:hypothetical protein